MGLINFLTVIWRRKWIIIILTLVAVIVSFILTIRMTPTYEVMGRLLVGNVQPPPPTTGLSSPGENYFYWVSANNNFILTAAEILRSPAVLEKIINEKKLNISLKELEENITVEPLQSTQVLRITVWSTNPEEAWSIASLLGPKLQEQFKEYGSSSNSSQPIPVNILELDPKPTSPSKPSFFINIGVTFLLALFVSIILAYLIEYFETAKKDVV